MDGQLSFNIHKLQSVVRNTIKNSQEKSTFRSGFQVSITSQSIPGLNEIDQQQIHTMLQIPYPDQIEEEAESPVNKRKKGIQQFQFKFVVSSSSSDSQLSLSPVQNQIADKSNSSKDKSFYLEKQRGVQDDQAKAVSTLKAIMRKKPENEQKLKETNYKLLSNNSSSLNINHKKSVIKSTYRPYEDSGRDRNDKQLSEKRQINFLKGLNQNQTLTENSTIEEYYQDGKIIVNMHSRDLLTFVRLQHEVDELKRKQDDFNVQKERHFNLAQKENEIEKNIQSQLNKSQAKKNHDAWWVGVALAKRFLRKARRSQSLVKVSKQLD